MTPKEVNEIIDADEIQQRQRAPYKFRGRLTIREVPILEREEKLKWWVDKSPTRIAEIETEMVDKSPTR